MAADTKSLIETAVTRFLDEVPALANLKLVAGLEFRARGEPQLYRVELPGPKVTKGFAADAKVHGDAKATGIEQVMKLIVNVVERQEERSRTRKAHH
jgi:hypothetical protein